MTPRSSVLFWVTVLAVVSPIVGYNVLMYCPMPSRSHHNLCRGVVDALVDRGHEVTLISGYKTNKAKFNDISVPELENLKEIQMSPSFEMGNKSVFEMVTMLAKMQEFLSRTMFSNDGVKKLLADKSQKFDVVIFEYFMNEMSIGFGLKYDCPVISLSSVSPMQWLAAMTNNPISIATVPNVFTTNTGKMNLWERTLNLLSSIMQELLGKFYMEPIQASLYEKYFPEESKKVSYKELVTKISATLVNSHPSIGIARALLPNTVEIGGYHIKDPEPLPADIKKLLDEAKNGAIYFSMGSNLKSKDMSPEIKASILKVFSGLKQTVLWKYEEDLPGTSKNLIIRKWMPQTGILDHPNVKLFISHGGLLSSTEAAHFGVPLLAIPIFGDQYLNAKSIQERGQGIYLGYTNMTEESLGWALNEILGNPKYMEVAKEVKNLYHDRSMRPRDLLTYHVEHVIRSKGAKHLAPAPLSRCSHMLLDVFGVIFAPVFAVSVLLSWITWKCCCARRKKAEKSDKKQKKN